MESNILVLHGVELRVEYDYSFDPGRWTLPNGDPGYPESEEIDINKVFVTNVDISNLVFNTVELFDKIMTGISELEEFKRFNYE